jgi:serine/threonine-protein kinase
MAQPTNRAPAPSRPTRLGQWEVIAKIAGGGMSAVYLGRRTEPAPDIPNVVALKIVRHDVAHDDRLLQMFLDEGKLIARLVHPNIVRTLEVGADADHDFIAMELMLGKNFAAIHDALVQRGVRLNCIIAAWVAARVAEALHYAHELKDEHGKPLALVHRDVNPANVFATFDGQVKLFDFGLAKSTSGDRSGKQLLAGKLSYLSPEQIMQMPLDRRSDVFSLGTTLWELLTSKRLFRRDTDSETVRAVQLGPIPDPRTIASELPEELARIAKTALERNRAHRYPSTAALAKELDAFVLSRTSAEDVRERLAQLVDTLFPDEQKRQSGWLKPAITISRSMRAVNPDAGPITARPPVVAPVSEKRSIQPPSIPPASLRQGPTSVQPAPTSSQRPPPLPSNRPTPPRPASGGSDDDPTRRR